MTRDVRRPRITAIARPFWANARRGQLTVQACAACGRLRHPPRWGCPWCGSPEFEWRRLSGRGRIWSYVVAHPPVLPAFENRLPLPIALVELDEDRRVRIVADVLDSHSTNLRIGAPVEAVFEAIDAEVGVPHWKVVDQP